MKRRTDYLLRPTAGLIVIVPVGKAAVDFPGMITVNETGKFLWELLAEERTEAELIDALEAKYDAPREQISADVEAFLQQLSRAGALEE